MTQINFEALYYVLHKAIIEYDMTVFESNILMLDTIPIVLLYYFPIFMKFCYIFFDTSCLQMRILIKITQYTNLLEPIQEDSL